MLIHGGTISSGMLVDLLGRRRILDELEASFWKTTLPGVVAMFLPISKAARSVCLIAGAACPRVEVLLEILQAFDQIGAVGWRAWRAALPDW